MAICQTSHQPLPRLPCANPASGHWYIKDPQTPQSPSPSSVLFPAAQLNVTLSRGAAMSQSRAVSIVFQLTGPSLSSSPWQSHRASLGSQLSHSQCEPLPLTWAFILPPVSRGVPPPSSGKSPAAGTPALSLPVPLPILQSRWSCLPGLGPVLSYHCGKSLLSDDPSRGNSLCLSTWSSSVECVTGSI